MKRFILFLIMLFNNSYAYGTATLSPAAINDVVQFVKFANMVSPLAIEPFREPFNEMRDYCDASKSAQVVDTNLLNREINNMDQLIKTADENMPSQTQISLMLIFKSGPIKIADRKSVRNNFISYLDMIRNSMAAQSFDECETLLIQLATN